jgi:hypothetical protein
MTMAKRDPERTRKIRVAVRYLLDHDCLRTGNQSRLAEHFHVSRQRVHQIVVEERQRDELIARRQAARARLASIRDGMAGSLTQRMHGV